MALNFVIGTPAAVRSKLAVVGLRVLSIVAGLACVKACTGQLTIAEVGGMLVMGAASRLAARSWSGRPMPTSDI